jgi:zinc transport system substrate-binding protein
MKAPDVFSKKSAVIVLVFIFLSAWGYAEELTVTVSIPPQKYVVDKISGGRVKVNVLIPKGADPHNFSLKPQDALALSKSTLYIGIGFPFEDSTLKQIAVSYKNLRIIDTSKDIVKIEEHGHELDPHIWISPENMLIIARSTFVALAEANPADKAFYEAGLSAFTEEIDALNARFTALFSKGNIPKSFLVYHPALGYFADDYDLTQLSVEADGKPPKAAELAALIDAAKRDNIRLFIIQPAHAGGAAQTVAGELGIKPRQIDILSEDWGAMMESLYAAFSEAAE